MAGFDNAELVIILVILCSKVFDEEKVSSLKEMFDWLIDPCLKQVKSHGSDLLLPYNELHLVQNQIRLLSSLLGIRSLLSNQAAGGVVAAQGNVTRFFTNTPRSG